MKSLARSAVTLTDPFWHQRLARNARVSIFQQWEQLERTGCFENFRLAAGTSEGFREGYFFADSDAYRWLDAAARVYATWPDAALKARMGALIALILKAQEPDGYLFTFNQCHFPGVRWRNLQIEHELYCHGHLIESGVSHYQATGEITLPIRPRLRRRTKNEAVANRRLPKICWTDCTSTRRKPWPL